MPGTEGIPAAPGTATLAGTARAMVLSAAETLFPGYFALTMATGVVSIACALLGLPLVARALLVVNWIAYPCLWALTLVRMAAFRTQLARDVSDHQRAPGFFTLVAGTCVLGTQNVVVADARLVGEILWWFGLGLWLVVMYGFFTAVTIRGAGRALEFEGRSIEPELVARYLARLSTEPPLNGTEFRTFRMQRPAVEPGQAAVPFVEFAIRTDPPGAGEEGGHGDARPVP